MYVDLNFDFSISFYFLSLLVLIVGENILKKNCITFNWSKKWETKI